jgi:AsmA protein
MRKSLIVVVAVVLVAILVLWLVPQFISADAYKGTIVSRLRAATGRDVTIGGNLSLSLFPRIAFEASNIAVANPPGGPSPDLARARKLDVALELIPLLSGRIVIDHLDLIDPTIALEIDKQGMPNWRLATAGPATTPVAAPAITTPNGMVTSGLAALASMRVGDLTISDGDITFVDLRSNQRRELSHVDVRIAEPAIDRPATVSGSAQWRGQTITLLATLGDPGVIMNESGKSPFEVAVTAKPITAKFTGTLAGAGTSLTLDGTADLAMPSVRGFIAWSGMGLALPRHGFGTLSIAGKVHADNGKAQFSDAKVALDTIEATGTVAIDLTAAEPVLTATLQTGILDFNPYLPPQSAGSGWSRETYDVAPLRQVAFDFDLAAQGVRYRRLTIGKSDIGLHLKDSHLVIDLRRVALYRGTAKGEIQLDVTRQTPRLAADLSMSGVQIGPLARDLAGITAVQGAGTATITATATGDSQLAMVKSLHGKGSFRVADAAVSGVDLTDMLHNVGGAFTGGGGTQISKAAGTFTIANGMMRNPDLTVSLTSMDATGAGTVNLPARTVDYRVKPQLIAGTVTVPVIISGPWDNLSYRPDLAGIAKGLVTAPGRAVEGAAGLGKNVGEGLGNGIGKTLNGLFGK